MIRFPGVTVLTFGGLFISCAAHEMQDKSSIRRSSVEQGIERSSADGSADAFGGREGRRDQSSQTKDAPKSSDSGSTTSSEPDAQPLPPQTVSGMSAICAFGKVPARHQTDFQVLCNSGKPTTAFTKAMAAPYKGGADQPLVTIKLVAANNLSELVYLNVMEIAKPVADVFAKRLLTKSGTVNTAIIRVSQSVTDQRAPSGGDDWGGFDVKFSTTAQIVFPVTLTTVEQYDVMGASADNSLYLLTSKLKEGAPDNADKIQADSLTFMMADGPSTTKVITINHQVLSDAGQTSITSTLTAIVAKALMADAFSKYAN